MTDDASNERHMAEGYEGDMARAGSIHVPEEIVCVDCGGPCHLLHKPPFQPGDIVAYRCRDCLDRWDVEVQDPDDDDRY